VGGSRTFFAAVMIQKVLLPNTNLERKERDILHVRRQNDNRKDVEMNSHSQQRTGILCKKGFQNEPARCKDLEWP
jgi:hypothetical protein